MMGKTRSPLQASDNFIIRLKDIQRKIRMSTGEEKSLREITDIIARMDLEDIERKILNNSNVKVDVQIRMDRRKQ